MVLQTNSSNSSILVRLCVVVNTQTQTWANEAVFLLVGRRFTKAYPRCCTLIDFFFLRLSFWCVCYGNATAILDIKRVSSCVSGLHRLPKGICDHTSTWYLRRECSCAYARFSPLWLGVDMSNETVFPVSVSQSCVFARKMCRPDMLSQLCVFQMTRCQKAETKRQNSVLINYKKNRGKSEIMKLNHKKCAQKMRLRN